MREIEGMDRLDNSILIKFLGNSPKVRLIDFFLDNKLLDFTKKELIEKVGMSYTTFYRIWDEFEIFGMVKVTRKVGRVKLYKLDSKNMIVKKMVEFEDMLIDQYIGHTQAKPIDPLRV